MTPPKKTNQLIIQFLHRKRVLFMLDAGVKMERDAIVKTTPTES